MRCSTRSVMVMLKLWVLACYLPAPSAVSFAGKRGCADSFETTDGDIQPALVKSLEAFVLSNDRLPTVTELATAAGLRPRAVSEQLEGASQKEKITALLQQGLENGQLKKLAAQRSKVLRSFAAYLENHLTLPDHEASSYEWDPQQAAVFFADDEELWEALQGDFHALSLKVERRVLQVYADYARTYGRTISLAELATELRVSEKDLSWIFDTAAIFEDELALVTHAKRAFPSHFKDVIDSNIFNEERAQRLVKAIETKKRLVVTTAVSGAKVDPDFLASIDQYCRKNDAALVVIPANMTTNSLDPVLLDKDWIHVVTNEVQMSKFLRISNIKVTAKQYDPLTSLDNVGPRSQTVIVGSPKLFQRIVPTVQNSKHPHMLISTGALTLPNYAGKKFIQHRGDYIANKRHMMGAVILERVNADIFAENHDAAPYHVRHIEYTPARKGFFDIDHFYTENDNVAERPEAIVLGDLHVAKLDRQAFARVKEEIKRLKPKRIILHDILDGETINHHEAEKQLSRGMSARMGHYNLSDELTDVVGVLNELLALDDAMEVVVVRSNHDLWLDRWLESGVFMKDPHNQAVGAMLANAVALKQVENPLEYAIKSMGHDPLAKDVFTAKLSDNARVRFLGLGDKYNAGSSEGQVEVGLHGHAGVNGSKLLSLRSLERATDRGIMAHTHTIGRRNFAVNVGTLTKLELPYNKDGISNWVQSVAVIGANGEIQLLMFDGKRFYATDRNRKSDGFFDDGFPFLVPNIIPDSDEGQVDQYGS